LVNRKSAVLYCSLSLYFLFNQIFKDSIYPEVKLVPDSAYERAECHMLIDAFQRVAGYLFKALKFKDVEAFKEIYKILDSYEKYVADKEFFSGKKMPGIIIIRN